MLTRTCCRPLPPVSAAVPQIELEQPPFQPAAEYGPVPGKVSVDVGRTLSTSAWTDAAAEDVQERRCATTR